MLFLRFVADFTRSLYEKMGQGALVEFAPKSMQNLIVFRFLKSCVKNFQSLIQNGTVKVLLQVFELVSFVKKTSQLDFLCPIFQLRK